MSVEKWSTPEVITAFKSSVDALEEAILANDVSLYVLARANVDQFLRRLDLAILKIQTGRGSAGGT